jgi:hypothetical protein
LPSPLWISRDTRLDHGTQGNFEGYCCEKNRHKQPAGWVLKLSCLRKKGGQGAAARITIIKTVN